MILLGVFVLIFSMNNKKNESLGSGNEEYNAGGIINGDKGYISSAQIIQTKTGTGPWDADDEPGNDSSEDNNIVRSFDQVIWTVESTMQMKSDSGANSLTGGTLNIEAKLPETCTYMKWDIESMSWTEGTGKLSNNGRTLSAQYKMSDETITVPGKQTLTLILKLEGAKNALEIKPEIKVWLEGNEENEKCTVTNVENVYVSSAPKYDIRLDNYSSGIETETNDGDARIYKYSLAFLLQGDSVSKGLKGVEYPQGDLTFDINYNLQRTVIGQSNYEDITNGNMKLYNYKYNNQFSDVLGNPENLITTSFPSTFCHSWGKLPYSNQGDSRRKVYQNGNLKMEDNGTGLIKVTISNYGYNGTFPDRTDYGTYSTDSAYSITDDIGFISIGMFYIQVNLNEETKKENTQCYINIEANNMKVNTVGGDTCTKEVNTANNTIRTNHITYTVGSYSKQIQFFSDNYGLLASKWGAGDAKTYNNSQLFIGEEITTSINNSKENWVYGIDELIKFDDEAIEPILLSNSSEYTVSGLQGISNMKFNILYAGKKDKSGWNSDSEMIQTTADKLVYFDTLNELKENGYTCVAVMSESKNGYITSGINIRMLIPIKIKETAKPGKVYQAVSDIWIYNEGNAPDRSTQTYLKTTNRSDFPPTVWSQGNLPYVKTSYDENGQMEQGSHGGGVLYGNSILVLGAEQKVELTSWNEDATERKTNYDIGRNENIINYRIAPQLNGNADIDGVTVKLTTTLPKGLEYVAGSSDYIEPDIINNSNGTTTLIWEIYNCSVGESIRTINFKAHINEETPNGTQYTTQTIILADKDKVGNADAIYRTVTNTITVTNLASHRLYKETDEPIVEKNQMIKYHISYKNNTDENVPDFQLLDILPYNGDVRGTKYNGTYILDHLEITGQTGLKTYISTDESVRNITAKDENIGISNNWKEVNINNIKENATAFAVKGEISEGQGVDIMVYLTPTGNQPKDIYVNSATAQTNKDSEEMTSTDITIQVVSRKIQGKVWEDSNRNGVIDSSEKYLEGTVVKLLNSTNNTEVIRTTTNTHGEYEFTDLAKGTYKVEVEIDSLHELTDKEVGTNREINSKFNQASKQTEEITKLNTISSPEIIEDNVNAGIRTIQFNINTKVEGVGGNISGEGEDVYERVDKGQDSKKDIIVTPNAGYRVDTITVNGEKITFTEESNHTVILNKFINMQEDKEVIVTFKDVRTSVLVHHYKEGTSEKLSEDVTINGEIGDSYTTQVASDIPQNYEVVNTPSNASGNMVASQTVVTYYYRLKTPTVNEQSINKNGTEKIENLTDEITYDIVYKATLEDYIGEAEVTIVDKLPYQIVIDSSDIAGGTYDATAKTITWTETIKDINSYVNKNNEITINKTIKVVYTGINQGTTNIKNVVTGKIKTKTPEKEFDEVTANETTTTEFTVNIPVSKIWEDDSNKLGQRPTRVTFKLVGSDGREYTKELAKPGTAGSSTTQDQSDANKWNDIFTNLPKYDASNNEITYTLTEINGNLTYYDAVLDSIGRIVTNTNKYGKVTVHYYIMNTDGTTTTTRVPDINGTEIPDVVIEGKEGDSYTTEEAKNINEKYELVAEKLPANATGTIEKYNEEKPQEVIYYYRLKPAKVIINYLEKDSNQVLSTQERIIGYVDDSYNTNTDHRKEKIEKDGKKYTLVEDSGNTEGTMTVAGTVVTYYYLQNTKATVRYVARDSDTHEIVKDLEEPYTQEGLVGDKFVTNEKAFIGYKLVESPTNKTITMTKEEQTLIYYYEPVYTGLIENHIDDKTGRVLFTEEHQIQVGTEYNIPSKEFVGYDLVANKLPLNYTGIMGEELITVNYYYIKKAVLEVNYIDINTKEPLTDQIVDNTKHEGDLYTTEQKEFENYDLVEVPSNASGTMVVETDEEGNITNNRTVVTYYYTQRAVVEEHHIDILTGEDIEEPTMHNGYVGDEYNIPSKEFLSYQLVEEDEEGNSMLPANSKGTMTAEKIVVNYYYNQPAKVVVHYVDKTTGKELEEINPETGELQNSQIVIEGFNQDEYETEAKEFKYYTLIESPEEPNGTMKVEIVKDEEGKDIVNNTIDVYYYYEAKTFNIGVEKEITGIIVNGERRAPTNGKLEKVEIYRKSTESTSVQVEYKIKVSNTGEVSGNATIEENIPEGMSLANNDGTWEEQEGKLIKVIPELGAGETKEYTVLLNWEQTGENMGEKANEVKLVETGNVPGFVDNNDKDNTSNANIIISVETGELPIGLILALVALVGLETVTLRYAVVLTKRQKNKK
ncbi:MAG: MucBP domain-containing protein [Clostridia bacterium]